MMVYLRVVGAIALLGLLAACDGPQVTEVADTPLVVRRGAVVRTADGTVVARMLTTAEAIAHLEQRAVEDPEFLDTPHESHSADGTTRTVTFRDLLNTLKGASQLSAVQRSQPATLDVLSDPPPPPQIVNPSTFAEDGVSGDFIDVGAEMDVQPREPPLGTYDVRQTIRLDNFTAGTLELPFVKGSNEPFPWGVSAPVQAHVPGTYLAGTTHTVQGGTGSANAFSWATGVISERPSR